MKKKVVSKYHRKIMKIIENVQDYDKEIAVASARIQTILEIVYQTGELNILNKKKKK